MWASILIMFITSHLKLWMYTHITNLPSHGSIMVRTLIPYKRNHIITLHRLYISQILKSPQDSVVEWHLSCKPVIAQIPNINYAQYIYMEHLEQLSTLYESNGSHILAINTSKVRNAIHFYMLTNHYYI